MKKAFTMIEIIFVIVVIGILSAIAIPRFGTTRDDASVSNIILNAKIALLDVSTYYTTLGNSNWINATLGDVTKVPLQTDCATESTSATQITPNTFVLCHNNVICLSFTTTDEGTLNVNNGAATSNVCESVRQSTSVQQIIGKTFQIGGSSVTP